MFVGYSFIDYGFASLGQTKKRKKESRLRVGECISMNMTDAG
jgi:hypothetical protein